MKGTHLIIAGNWYRHLVCNSHPFSDLYRIPFGGFVKNFMYNKQSAKKSFYPVNNPFPYWDSPKFKEAAGDNWNVAINP